jgi:hypothetical protein
MEKRTYRIGQVAPGSNITMESEFPALLRPGEGISQIAENRLSVPATSTTICMARGLPGGLGRNPIAPNAAGRFSGRYGLELTCAGGGRLSPRRSRR